MVRIQIQIAEADDQGEPCLELFSDCDVTEDLIQHTVRTTE